MPVVVITGGTRGIGRAILERFATHQYTVVCIYKTTHDKAQELMNTYSNVDCFACDIANEQEVLQTTKQILQKYPIIDVLINNAGISKYGLFSDATISDYHEIFDINVKGAFLLTNALIKPMLSQKSGSIINISSMWGEVGASLEVLYSMSKGALISFTKALAKEMGLSGIRVNCVTPGVIDTDMLNDIDSETILSLKEETPLSRLGTPKDIANIVYFLANEESSFITGQIIGVNGGFVI